MLRHLRNAIALLLLCASGLAHAQLVSAVLPTSRSVQVGGTATVFATLINAGPTTATGCSIAPATSIPATFVYQTTNPATNAVTGTPNTPVTIGPGGAQSFVIAFRPTAAFSPTEVALSFSCAGVPAAPSNPGLNTLLLSASNTPVPDIVALGATVTNNGIAETPSSTGATAFAVATANVGASGLITASADTGSATLPVTVTLCLTNPATGACASTIGPSVTTTIVAGQTPTFGIFVTGTGGTVPFSPAVNRIFVRFKDATGATRGSTSVAIRTRPQATAGADGIYIGTTSSGAEFLGIVLDTGTYWFLYSGQDSGLIQGTGTFVNGSFSSSDARDFTERLGIQSATLSGNYIARQSLQGSAFYPGLNQRATFSGSYDTRYDQTPSLSIIAGTYSGDSAIYSGGSGSETTTVVITSAGAISGISASGCRFSGSARPHTKGNVYDVSITFAGGVCAGGTSTFTGIGFYNPNNRVLGTFGLNSARSNAFISVVTKL